MSGVELQQADWCCQDTAIVVCGLEGITGALTKRVVKQVGSGVSTAIIANRFNGDTPAVEPPPASSMDNSQTQIAGQVLDAIRTNGIRALMWFPK